MAIKSIPTQRSSWVRQNIIPIILFGGLGTLFSGCVYLGSTQVSGTEFNPQTWELRSFSYRRDPFSQLQLTPIRYGPANEFSSFWNSTTVKAVKNTVDNAISTHLATGASVVPPRWDLVNWDGFSDEQGESSIFVSLASARHQFGNNFWVDWSADNPKSAKVLWPAVQHLTNIGAYSVLPELMDAASKPNLRIDELKDLVAKSVLPASIKKCRVLLDEDQSIIAIGIAKESLQFCDSPVLEQLSLGQSDAFDLSSAEFDSELDFAETDDE